MFTNPIETLDALDSIFNSLATDSDVHSSQGARIAKAKEGHAVVAFLREKMGTPPVVAKLNEPPPQSDSQIAAAINEVFADSPAAIKSAEMLAAMDANVAREDPRLGAAQNVGILSPEMQALILQHGKQ